VRRGGVTVTHDRRRTARHEAGHAAAFVIGGWLPKQVTADRPEEGTEGWVSPDWDGESISPQRAADVAIAVLMGPLAVGEPGWPPEWPIDPDVAGDQRQLAFCCRYLKLDEDGYFSLVKQAHELAGSREFIRLRDLIARALELKDELDADDLRWLVGSETLFKYGIAEEKDHATQAS
jgi:hypothetical protein